MSNYVSLRGGVLFDCWNVRSKQMMDKLNSAENLNVYQVTIFQIITFSRENDYLKCEIVRIECLRQAVRRPNKASFFYMSGLLSYTIVITRGKVLIWLIFLLLFVWSFTDKKIDSWILILTDWMRIRHLFLWQSNVKVPFGVLFKNFRLWGLPNLCKIIRRISRNNLILCC